MRSHSEIDVLIVGAGMAGLMAANQLQQQGIAVLVLDKEDNVGGRMATRRVGPGQADYGAQFFTVRHDTFRAYVARWLADGLIFEWSRGWSDGSLAVAVNDGYPRYAGTQGMTAVCQRLARRLPVQTGIRLVSVTAVASGWLAEDENGRLYSSRALLLTPPAPQSMALLDAGRVPLTTTDRAALEQITYAPCLVGLFWVEGEVNLPEPGALQRPSHCFPWIADNRHKGISPEAALVTLHAAPSLTWEVWNAPVAEKIARMTAGLRPFLAPDAVIHKAEVHQWPYALPVTLHPERTLIAHNLPPLAFAGDAFGEPRVEGAALSGLAAAAAFL